MGVHAKNGSGSCICNFRIGKREKTKKEDKTRSRYLKEGLICVGPLVSAMKS